MRWIEFGLYYTEKINRKIWNSLDFSHVKYSFKSKNSLYLIKICLSLSLSRSSSLRLLLKSKSMSVPSSVSIWEPPSPVSVSSKTVKLKSFPTSSVTESPHQSSPLLTKKDWSEKLPRTRLQSTLPEPCTTSRDSLAGDTQTKPFNTIRNSCPMKSSTRKVDLTSKCPTFKAKPRSSPLRKSPPWFWSR